jgi:hypothetical protein
MLRQLIGQLKHQLEKRIGLPPIPRERIAKIEDQLNHLSARVAELEGRPKQ